MGKIPQILVTAFEPFGGEALNPALAVLESLPGHLAGCALHKRVLPTAFVPAGQDIKSALDALSPDALIMLGQAGGIPGLRIERQGINLDAARIPDNLGYQPKNQPIVPHGPDTHPVSLPVEAMVQAIADLNLTVETSDCAGSFVCNHVLYTALHHIKDTKARCLAGFIHLPYLPEQAAPKTPPPPAMPLAAQRQGVLAALAAVCQALKLPGQAT